MRAVPISADEAKRVAEETGNRLDIIQSVEIAVNVEIAKSLHMYLKRARLKKKLITQITCG